MNAFDPNEPVYFIGHDAPDENTSADERHEKEMAEEDIDFSDRELPYYTDFLSGASSAEESQEEGDSQPE